MPSAKWENGKCVAYIEHSNILCQLSYVTDVVGVTDEPPFYRKGINILTICVNVVVGLVVIGVGLAILIHLRNTKPNVINQSQMNDLNKI